MKKCFKGCQIQFCSERKKKKNMRHEHCGPHVLDDFEILKSQVALHNVWHSNLQCLRLNLLGQISFGPIPCLVYKWFGPGLKANQSSQTIAVFRMVDHT